MAAGSQSTSPEHCSSWPVEQSSPPKSPHASVCASLHSPDLCLRHLAFATGWFSPLDWRLASYGILCWRIASFAQPSVALGSCRHSVVRSPLLKVVAERVGFGLSSPAGSAQVTDFTWLYNRQKRHPRRCRVQSRYTLASPRGGCVNVRHFLPSAPQPRHSEACAATLARQPSLDSYFRPPSPLSGFFRIRIRSMDSNNERLQLEDAVHSRFQKRQSEAART
jgi:hypothetical protein